MRRDKEERGNRKEDERRKEERREEAKKEDQWIRAADHEGKEEGKDRHLGPGHDRTREARERRSSTHSIMDTSIRTVKTIRGTGTPSQRGGRQKKNAKEEMNTSTQKMTTSWQKGKQKTRYEQNRRQHRGEKNTQNQLSK